MPRDLNNVVCACHPWCHKAQPRTIASRLLASIALVVMLSGLSRLGGTRASPQALSRARHAFQSQQGRSLTQANALNYPRPLVVEPSAPHTATVIMLHGLGDTGAGWYAIGPELSPALPHVKFVFPSAPTVRYTASLNPLHLLDR